MKFLLKLAFLAATIPAAALARPASLPVTLEQEGYRVMAQFASCIVDRNAQIAASLLNAEPGSAKERALSGRIASMYDICLLSAGKLRFQPLLLRGAMATELYRLEFKADKAPTVPASILIADPFANGDPTVDPAARADFQLLSAFAMCVVRASPSKVRELVLSDFGSAGEKGALAALSPAFNPCFPQNGTAKFNKTSLRGILAEGLYRTAKAIRVASGRSY